MHQFFGEIPVLHEWLGMTRDQWSDELLRVARESHPGPPVEQDAQTAAEPPADTGTGEASPER